MNGFEQPVALPTAPRHTAPGSGAPADVLHLRVKHDAQPAGMSLGQARVLLAGMTRLLQAAALAVIGPAPRFAGRRPDVVKSFVEQDVRFAHADAEGTLLAVFTRLDDQEGPAPDGVGQLASRSQATVRLVPFQRRAGVLLAGALGEVVEAVREHRPARAPATPPAADPAGLAAGSPAVTLGEPPQATWQAPGEALRPLVLRGVSADLCDALLGMVTAPRVRTLELSFYWGQSAGLDTPAVVRAAFHRVDSEALARLRDELAALPEPRRRTAVYGQVTRLDRGDGDDGGVATIHGVVGRATPRTVQVAVSGPEYDDAIRAYRTRLPVVATGRLRRSGGVHVLIGRFSVATAVVAGA